ncbi:hypothetical protein FXO37_15980 [Capsicum annuum]|nr:hypothetical protein FXO37_15980 [Capsicum annuum]
MTDNTPTKMVTRSISHSDPDLHTVSTFDLKISQFEEEDALPSEEVRGIGHKRKVKDDVSSPDNDERELVKENVRCYVKELPSESPHMCCYSNNNVIADLKEELSVTHLQMFSKICFGVYTQMHDCSVQAQLVRIHGMPLAMQVWLCECCSGVDPKIIVKHGSRIPRLLNWETTNRRPHFEAFIEGMLADVDNPVVYRNITATLREMAILQLPSVDPVEDTTSDDFSFDHDFQDAPPASKKNKEKKKVDTAFYPPHKKQKQVKSVPSCSNIPSRSSSRNTARPHISISKASKRSLSPIGKHQKKKVVTQKTVPRRTLPKQPPILLCTSASASCDSPILNKNHSFTPFIDCPYDFFIENKYLKWIKEGLLTIHELMTGVLAYSGSCSNSFACERTTPLEVIPSSLLNIDFYKKKIDIDWQCHLKYKNRDESDPFEVIFINDIPQQRSGSVDCGIYVTAYSEFLTGDQGVPNQEFDIALLRTRYVALL